MQRAKTFFYVSLGTLALAVAFQLGAQSARGQGGASSVAGITFTGAPNTMCGTDGSGTVFLASFDRGQLYPPSQFILPRPGTVIACAGEPHDGWVVVLYDNGEAYRREPGTGAWALLGNLFSASPVQTTRSTWGRIKAERR